jgi:hypothetical protein
MPSGSLLLHTKLALASTWATQGWVIAAWHSLTFMGESTTIGPHFWGGELGVLDEIMTAGRFAPGFDPQRNNSVQPMCELINASRLSRLLLKFDFGDWRSFSSGSNCAAINCAFDLASSEPQKPGFAFNNRHKTRTSSWRAQYF